MKTSAVLLKPAFKDYLWGGTRLRTEYGKKCDLDKIAESWELSAHKDGESVIASGEYAGLKLSEYIEKCGHEILGKRGAAFDKFPILIKFIDAQDNLSIQVHPSDEYALKNEGEYGKTEVWYVLSSQEGASLYYGFKTKISADEYRRRIADNTLTEVLNKVDAKKGDVFFVKPGTVHAIGAGLMICEIQQNSNTTYRVYDYDRRGADGKPRELHIEKAIAVSNTTPISDTENYHEIKEYDGYKTRLIASCKYFTSEKIDVSDRVNLKLDTESFKSVIVTEGSAVLELNGEKTDIKKGDSIFVPSQNSDMTIIGECELILSYV